MSAEHYHSVGIRSPPDAIPSLCNGNTPVTIITDHKPLVVWFYWVLTPQQQPGSYQGGEMMMMKSVIWWRKPEYPEETTDLRH